MQQNLHANEQQVSLQEQVMHDKHAKLGHPLYMHSVVMARTIKLAIKVPAKIPACISNGKVEPAKVMFCITHTPSTLD
jgi:hypothetical protein